MSLVKVLTKYCPEKEVIDYGDHAICYRELGKFREDVEYEYDAIVTNTAVVAMTSEPSGIKENWRSLGEVIISREGEEVRIYRKVGEVRADGRKVYVYLMAIVPY